VVIMFQLNKKKYIFTAAVLLFFTVTASMADGQPVIKAVNGTSVATIVIDPGHGGHDRGAVGLEGTTEKDVTLVLARLIAAELKPRYNILLTRTGDYQVSAGERIAVANNNRADLFISLHVGGGFSKSHNAVSVYFLNAGHNKGRNYEPFFSGTDIPVDRPCLVWDEAHYRHYRLSKAFADLMKQSCIKAFRNCCRVKTGDIAVLKGADMPAVMVEIGCLSSPFWEKQFRDHGRLLVVSNMICEAIQRLP